MSDKWISLIFSIAIVARLASVAVVVVSLAISSSIHFNV